ncbi:MAG: DEAD/DEAH box helicase family protein [Defluviitaleaceae bacterium]|nr:DEAD/DEAH box helicase family protein [Defluviitaleaceae bacterium]MCL2273466.1 DEAD/DEAH box helicase family protein [Defluviitaleaceae bacterium]
MNDIAVSLLLHKFTQKPSEAEAAIISSSIAKNVHNIKRNELKLLAQAIGENGVVFCPATFNNGARNSDNFNQTQLIALDFDNKVPDKFISFKSVQDRADYYDLPILFSYETYTSRNHDKFRVVFLNDAPIPDTRTAKAMLQALHTIFPEADPQGKSPVQMYYGGKGLLHYNEANPEINASSLFTNLTHYFEDTHGPHTYRRKVAEFARVSGISLNEKKLLDVSVTEEVAERDGAGCFVKNLPNSTTILSSFGEKLTKRYRINFGEGCTHTLSASGKTDFHRTLRAGDFDSLRSCCQLFREFENGSRRLPHSELFGLATNLAHVETGAKWFIGTLRSVAYYDNRPDKYRKWQQDFRYIKAPSACVGFCPFANDCTHGMNIISTAKVKHNKMERLANYQETYVSLDEAVDDFKRNLLRTVDADDGKWHVIKAQTALGKTRTYLEYLKDTQKKVLIAVPTLALMQEICDRATQSGIDIIASPSLRESKDLLPDDIWNDIEGLYEMGKSVIPYLQKHIREDNPSCAALFKQYLTELSAFKNNDGHGITTHKRLLTMDTDNYDLIIIDEDIILNSVIQNKCSISIRQLKKLRTKAPPNSALLRKVQAVLRYVKKHEFFTLRKIEYDKDYEDISAATDISSFCAAKYFCFCKAKSADGDNNQDESCVHFLKPVVFKGHTTRIMVSATADETICNLYFGKSNVDFHECKCAQNAGTFRQYYNIPMSRQSIGKDNAIIKRIINWSGFTETISFKKFKQHYGGELHFGNTAGYDGLKGMSVNIIGTPHQPEWIYKLFALSIGLDTDPILKPGVTVNHNGYRFRFTTYDNASLRAIQFYIIESELEQAVGRARLLREASGVINLFSNFPLRHAKMLTWKDSTTQSEN